MAQAKDDKLEAKDAEQVMESPEEMADEETEAVVADKIVDDIEVPVEEVADVEEGPVQKKPEADLTAWYPKTELGRMVKSGEITDINEILDQGRKILEPEITDKLLPNMDIELLAIGQSKGKFGGGQRRVFRQTQKKTREGNKPKFSAFAVCGNYDGYVGYGYGKAKETVPAREKSFRKCKLSVFKIRRACSSWECTCGTPHSIPYKVQGKCGSVEVTLMPAPKGTGLVAEKEIAKILKLAGIKDIWSKTKGKTRTKINHIKATLDALHKLTETKIKPQDIKKLNIVSGKTKVRMEN